jgi:hypothetical protein
MADAVDPAELLDVEVDQLAGPCPLVADDLRLGVERLEPTEAVAAQDQAHGGDRAAEPAGDGGARQALAAQRQDLGLRRLAQAGWAVVRPGRAVGQAGLALQGMASSPLAHGLGRDPGRGGDAGHAPALSQALDHQASTMRRVLGILVDVHPAAPGWGCELGSHNLPPRPRVDNLHSNDS